MSVDSGSDEPWSVGAVPGLALWLDGSQGLFDANGTVTAWTDQSGNGNDAHLDPQAQAAAPTVSLMNGKRALHFDPRREQAFGTQLTIDDSPTLQWGTNDFYLVTVVRWINQAADEDTLQYAQGLFFGKFGQQQGVQLYGNVQTGNGPTTAGVVGWSSPHKAYLQAGVNDGAVHLVVVQGHDGILDVFVDGKAGAVSGTAAVEKSAPGAPVWIGAAYGKQHRLNGDIGEIIAVNGAIAPMDRASIESYLKVKYATP